MNLNRLLLLYQNFFLAAAGAVITVGIAGLVLVPAGRSVMKLYERVNALRVETAELSRKADLLASLDEESLNRDLLTVTTAVPIDKSLPTILGTIDGVAAATGATVFDVSLQSPGALATESARPAATAKKPGQSLKVEVIARGTYDQLKQFLVTIGNVRRFLPVEEFNLTLRDTGVNLNLSLSAPYGSVPLLPGGAGKFSPLSAVEESTLAKLGGLPLMIAQVQPTTPQIGQIKENPFAP